MPGKLAIGPAVLIATGCLPTAVAAETSKSFQVSATIANGCAVTSGAGGNWGTINLGTVAGTHSGNAEAGLISGAVSGIQVDCTPGMSVNLTANSGLNPAGGVRQLASQAERIGYELRVGSGATNWTSQAIGLAFPLGTSRQTLPVVARVNLSGTAKAGAYSDSVQVTLTW